MSSVYELCSSGEERPGLDLSGVDDWDESFASTNEPMVELAASSDPSGWDYFLLSGTLGLASQRLTESIIGWAGDRVISRSVLLNGCLYFVLLAGKTVDVLDLTRSEYTFFRVSPGRIKSIESFVFRKGMIPDRPWVFTIPERRGGVFVTGQVVEELRRRQFTGIGFQLRWNE